MRRLLLQCLLCLAFAQSAFAQGRGNHNGPPSGTPPGLARGHSDDHNDSKQVETGYVVITPSGGGSLAVFETFGLKNGAETTQAGILPSDLTTSAVVFVNSSGRLSRNLGIALVNPSSSNANITLTLRMDDGSLLATEVLTVPALHQTARFLTDLFSNQSAVPSDFTGMLTITSATPVSMIGLRFRGNNFSTLPVTNLAGASAVPTIATGIGGPGAILLPHFAADGGWATEIVIANTGSSAVTVRVDLFKPDGTPLTTRLNGESGSSFTGISIPANGVTTLSPRDGNGDSRF